MPRQLCVILLYPPGLAIAFQLEEAVIGTKRLLNAGCLPREGR